VTKGHHCYVVGEMVGKRNGLATIDMQFLPDSVHFVGADDIGGTMLRCHELDVDPRQGLPLYGSRRNPRSTGD
jgi:hypothetical protein